MDTIDEAWCGRATEGAAVVSVTPTDMELSVRVNTYDSLSVTLGNWNRPGFAGGWLVSYAARTEAFGSA